MILCPYWKRHFDVQMWYNLRHGGHDCLWYHIYVHDNYISSSSSQSGPEAHATLNTPQCWTFLLPPPGVSKSTPPLAVKGGTYGRELSVILPNVDFHDTFRDLLYAANLWHGTDGFTSPLKEGVLRIFSTLKIRELGYPRTARYL
jgi:hypothetical protein